MTIRIPGPPEKCPRCNAPVAWWWNANREGRKVPVDLSWDNEKGTVQQIVSGDGATRRLYAKVLTKPELEEATSRGERLYVLHAKTCSANRPHNPRPAHVRVDIPTHRTRSRSRR